MVTYTVQKAGADPKNASACESAARSLKFSWSQDGLLQVNGGPFPEAIRTAKVSGSVSDIAVHKVVRDLLTAEQRRLGAEKSCVAEGRDMATVVFPDAHFKFYLTASPEVRAQRRQREWEALGIASDFAEILKNLEERDRKDSTREHSPLKQDKNAQLVDTSHFTLDQQIAMISALVQRDIP
jgi:cytidylate kinase